MKSPILVAVFCLIALNARAETGEPSSLKDSPTPSSRSATPVIDEWPGRVIVHICYPANPLVAQACRQLRETLRAKSCAGGFEVIELNHPRAAEIRAALGGRKLPAHVPVLIDGYGVYTHADPTSLDEELAVLGPRSAARPIHDERARVNSAPNGQSPLDGILNEMLDRPSIWRSSCANREACFPSAKCLGTFCKSPEETGPGEWAKLLCNARSFQHADQNSDGIVDAEEMASDLCGEAKGSALVGLDYRLIPLPGEKALSSLDARHSAKDLSSLQNALKELRGQGTGHTYRKAYAGELYRLEYSGPKGEREQIYLSDVFQSDAEARAVARARDGHFPAQCGKLVGSPARRCTLRTAARVYVLETRAPQVPCLRAVEHDSPFHLYSPHQRVTDRPALAERRRRS